MWYFDIVLSISSLKVKTSLFYGLLIHSDHQLKSNLFYMQLYNPYSRYIDQREILHLAKDASQMEHTFHRIEGWASNDATQRQYLNIE